MASIVLVYRDYWSGKDYAPYRNETHTLDDKEFGQLSELDGLFRMAGIKDGDEFTLTVTKTGNRPFGVRRVILQSPNKYGLETDEQMRNRLSE